MREWQPIETAPMDIDVLLGGLRDVYHTQNAEKNWVAIGRYYSTAGDADDPIYWFRTEWTHKAPTHWMPLPTPPAQGGAG